MKLTNASILIFVLAIAASSQKADEILATANGHVFRLSDVSSETRLQVEKFPSLLAQTRTSLLDQLLNQRALSIEAKSMGISVGKLLAAEKAKAPAPTEAAISAVYDANRSALGDRTLDQARKQIVAFLRNEPEQKVIGELIARLKTKYKISVSKDVNAVGLAPTETVATVNGLGVTAKEFEAIAKIELFNLRADLDDLILENLNSTVYAALLEDEAKKLSVDSGTLIAREITDRMKDFSDEERLGLETALRERLYAKYQVKITYQAPDPPVENISTDDDPASGPVDAPVTIVMFSDFQCSACSATHPVLKKAMDGFSGKIRFVVRDFPLESIHENAWLAALAAGAAKNQGKFFEYIEILYKNQDALDDASLRKYAAQIGLNAKQFELDFNSAAVAAEVRKDMADGEAYVISSTPTIFVNGVRVRNISLNGFKTAVEKALAK